MKLIDKIKAYMKKAFNKVKAFFKEFKITITIEYKGTAVGIGAKK